MKGLFKKTVILLLLAAAIYIPFFTLRMVSPDEIGVVEERESGRVASVYIGRVNFVWQGALFWLYRTYEVPTTGSVSFTAMIPVPPLQDLKSGHYAVQIPLRASYVIQRESFSDREYLSDYGDTLEEHIASVIKGVLAKELDQYFRPAYRPPLLETGIDPVIGEAETRAAGELKDAGIRLSGLKRAGSPVIPDLQVYNEGLRFLADVRTLEHKNAMELIQLKMDLERGKLSDEEYYKKLYRMSRIIKQNPDIIKYIYIDKITGNGKVNLPNVMKDFPGGEGKEWPRSAVGDVDNLRP
ncbi:MAG: hypothetical protein JXA20_03315 [Spirochaetes bacterium]|nr:hypothetical protein [Spirochaetota bacterium]